MVHDALDVLALEERSDGVPEQYLFALGDGSYCPRAKLGIAQNRIE
jgi:hypothetical protein